MREGLPLFPEQASTVAAGVDALYFFQVAVTLIMSGLIFLCVAWFAIRYRRRSESERPRPIHGSMQLEIFWSATPLVVMMIMFYWGTDLYFRNFSPSGDALEMYVIGKQWMWKIQHPEGRREINELHVPVGRTIKLTMASEDVIHSFYVPAFRVKRDVVPGQFASVWFQSTRPGKYHLFCAEYCGNQHSGMIGWVYVMEPHDFEAWLSGGATGESMAVAGERQFQRLGCAGCHRPDSKGRGPSLVGSFGRPVPLRGGQRVLFDEAYIRESVLNPQAKVVAGFEPVMPTFQGQITEEGLLQITAYIKSLRATGREDRQGTQPQ
jgi:cytochrome c oxidase subunit 2